MQRSYWLAVALGCWRGRVGFLNPNCLFHVALRLDHPNAFDREMAASCGVGPDLDPAQRIHASVQFAGI